MFHKNHAKCSKVLLILTNKRQTDVMTWYIRNQLITKLLRIVFLSNCFFDYYFLPSGSNSALKNLLLLETYARIYLRHNKNEGTIILMTKSRKPVYLFPDVILAAWIPAAIVNAATLPNKHGFIWLILWYLCFILTKKFTKYFSLMKMQKAAVGNPWKSDIFSPIRSTFEFNIRNTVKMSELCSKIILSIFCTFPYTFIAQFGQVPGVYFTICWRRKKVDDCMPLGHRV